MRFGNITQTEVFFLPENLEKLANSRTWYQKINLGNNIITPGCDNSEIKWSMLNLTKNDILGKKVLDVGCNTGFFSFKCAELGAKSVKGIDKAEDWGGDLIQVANNLKKIKYIDNVDFVKGDFLTYDFKEKFDLVCFMSCIYYMGGDIKQILDKIDSVCRDEIVLYTRINHSKSDDNRYIPTFQKLRDDFFKVGFEVYSYTNLPLTSMGYMVIKLQRKRSITIVDNLSANVYYAISGKRKVVLRFSNNAYINHLVYKIGQIISSNMVPYVSKCESYVRGDIMNRDTLHTKHNTEWKFVVQEFVEGGVHLHSFTPKSVSDELFSEIQKMVIFDFVINNYDRGISNFMMLGGKIILVDNGESLKPHVMGTPHLEFVINKKLTKSALELIDKFLKSREKIIFLLNSTDFSHLTVFHKKMTIALVNYRIGLLEKWKEQ